jgi:hypothetical protein
VVMHRDDKAHLVQPVVAAAEEAFNGTQLRCTAFVAHALTSGAPRPPSPCWPARGLGQRRRPLSSSSTRGPVVGFVCSASHSGVAAATRKTLRLVDSLKRHGTPTSVSSDAPSALSFSLRPMFASPLLRDFAGFVSQVGRRTKRGAIWAVALAPLAPKLAASASRSLLDSA